MPVLKRLRINKKRFFVISLLLILLSVLTFEFLSRRPCADIYKNFVNPCFDLTKKYVEPKIGYFPLSYPESKNLKFEDINTPGFFGSIEKRTFYVPMSEVKANGRACLNFAFVADELPESAKRYVTFHENIHLEGEYNETRTNYLAARIEPVGMFQTVGFSLWYGLKQLEFSKLPCQIGRLWFVFKIYFLNIS